MTTNHMVQIVLVRIETTQEPIPGQWTTTRGDGLNPVPKLRDVRIAKALVWLRKGSELDVEKAEMYAKSEGYLVRCYSTDERDPLGKARQEALAA